MFNPALILQLVKVLPREGATLGLSLLAGAQNLFQFFSAPVLAFLAPALGVAGVAGEASASLANGNVSWRLGIVRTSLHRRRRSSSLRRRSVPDNARGPERAQSRARGRAEQGRIHPLGSVRARLQKGDLPL